MEEKERYEYYLGTNSIKDNKTNQIYDYVVDLLNQQDKENQQLKQQLHDLPKKIVEEIINNADLQSFDYGERYCEEEASNNWAIDLEDLKEILDTILKKFGGGNE